MFKVRTGQTNRPQQSTDYSIGGRIWVQKDGELYLGWGRVILLEKIEELGSISAAARAMKLGYRNAWLWIEAMNRLAPSPLIEKRVGGQRGGQARVTEEGRKAIARYKEIRRLFQEFIKGIS
ncbi:MAG: LysR family transcriptional regulator [Chloroflexi bacterium]|nr:LysR family transcriptional regulator [Chloroflexota bacterium]